MSSPGFCGGRFIWFLPALCWWVWLWLGRLFGVECRHPRGQCEVRMPMLEWGRAGVWCTTLGGVDFTFFRLGLGSFVTDELSLCTREIESPSSSVIVMKPPMEPREVTAFSCAKAAPWDRSVLHPLIEW